MLREDVTAIGDSAIILSSQMATIHEDEKLQSSNAREIILASGRVERGANATDVKAWDRAMIIMYYEL